MAFMRNMPARNVRAGWPLLTSATHPRASTNHAGQAFGISVPIGHPVWFAHASATATGQVKQLPGLP